MEITKVVSEVHSEGLSRKSGSKIGPSVFSQILRSFQCGQDLNLPRDRSALHLWPLGRSSLNAWNFLLDKSAFSSPGGYEPHQEV